MISRKHIFAILSMIPFFTGIGQLTKGNAGSSHMRFIESEYASYDAEVEYLELGEKGAYIDTHYHAVAGLGFEFQMSMAFYSGYWNMYIPFGFVNDWQGGNQRTYALGWYLTNRSRSLGVIIGDGRLPYTNNSNFISKDIPVGDVVTVLFYPDSNMFSVDDTVALNGNVLTYDSETRNVWTMRLFQCIANGRDVQNTNTAPVGFRLHRAILTLDGVVVRDYVPVRIGEGESAVGLMYDRVSGELFGNEGTGYFIVGPDKEEVE